MSSETPELKAGHPPAVKVGGMRVVTKQKQQPHKEQDSDAFDDKYQDTTVYNPMGTPTKVDLKDVTVTGAVQGQEKSPKPAAVKVAHEPHLPSKEKHTKKPANQIIQQPGRRS